MNEVTELLTGTNHEVFEKVSSHFKSQIGRAITEVTNQTRNQMTVGIKAVAENTNHLLSIIRWNQMELELYRTLELLIREGRLDNENGPAILIRLDDLRTKLRTEDEMGKVKPVSPPFSSDDSPFHE